jgi:type I restriction enzyme S subunit
MTQMPSSWQLLTLGDVAHWTSGGTPSSKNSEYYDGDIPWVCIGDLNEGYVLETAKRITKAGLDSSSAKIMPKGTIMLAMYATSIGDTGMMETSMATNQAIACGVPNPEIIAGKYLLYYLQSQKHEFFAAGRGGAQPNINQGIVKGWQIPVPPIDEQHKIVELLEDHLSRLDAALVDIKQAKLKAAQFRRSFVHEMTTAIEGSEVMGILDICDVYQPKTISTKELIADGEFPVYGANGQIGFYDKFNHEDSEVTVTCRGATCGTVNVIPAMSWITGNAMVFRPKDSRIQKGFLEYVLRGMDWTPVITGTAQPQITRTSIQDVFVNVPSPDVQGEIYMKLESSLTQVTNAELLSKKVEMQAANLRRSLLQAAFTGQLTKEVVSV